MNFILANSWFSFFLFSVIYIFFAAYLSYNYIEPHFNSKIGMTNRERNSIFSDNYIGIWSDYESQGSDYTGDIKNTYIKKINNIL